MNNSLSFLKGIDPTIPVWRAEESSFDDWVGDLTPRDRRNAWRVAHGYPPKSFLEDYFDSLDHTNLQLRRDINYRCKLEKERIKRHAARVQLQISSGFASAYAALVVK